MAGNTIMTAKNSFLKGILMDFSPENTSADSLTSALNATFVTFNGNEGSLLNDMGNGRVETAYLPEGYVPVGSCEFGDIIYVISYNPLIDKAQIGCFPSPERNLSSDELGQEPIEISYKDFLEVTDVWKYYAYNPVTHWNELTNLNTIKHIEDTAKINQWYIKEVEKIPEEPFPFVSPTGESVSYAKMKVDVLSGKLNKQNLKKILYKSNLNSGDSYIITHENNDEDLTHITDYKTNVRQLDSFPKLLNVKVVSIEEGKMNILDSNVKWYDVLDENVVKYFKFCAGKNAVGENIDINAHRSVVSSAYNIYSSKVSGKLALLIELEKITGFSCSWEAIASNIKYRYCLSRFYNSFEPKKIENNIIWTDIIPEPENEYKYIWYQYKIEDSDDWSDNYYIDNKFNFYDIYLNYSWETDNKNINPKYSILLESNIKDEKGNTIIDNNDKRKNIVVPDIYLNLYQKPLHRFGRLYELENAKLEFLYDDYVKLYLNGYIDSNNVKIPGKIENSGNIENTNIVSILHFFENGKYQYDEESLPSNENDSVLVGKYLLNSKGEPITISDDVINNTFKMLTRKKLHTFKIPANTPNINYHYKVCPAMPYGMLEEYSIEDVIQLDKLGTTNIQVKDWRYYIYSNLLTLTWGLEAYVEPGKNISEVTLEFYDNCGICAAYHAKNYNSYNGTFTINIPLDNKSDVLDNVTYENKEFIHAGNIVLGNIEKDINGNNKPFYTRDVNEIVTNSLNEKIGYKYTKTEIKKGTNTYYYDDSGTLYSNLLYLVKIIVTVGNKSQLNDYGNTKTYVFHRWLWTNELFNDNYQSVSDFDYLQPTLNLDLTCNYTTKRKDFSGEDLDPDLIEWKVQETTDQQNNLNNSYNISYYILSINGTDKSNIKLISDVWLLKNYNTFKLNTNHFDDMNVVVSLANEYIENSTELPEIQYFKDVIPGVDHILKEKFSNDIHEFKLSAELNNSQYAIDVSLQRETNSKYLKLTTYGKFI